MVEAQTQYTGYAPPMFPSTVIFEIYIHFLFLFLFRVIQWFMIQVVFIQWDMILIVCIVEFMEIQQICIYPNHYKIQLK